MNINKFSISTCALVTVAVSVSTLIFHFINYIIVEASLFQYKATIKPTQGYDLILTIIKKRIRFPIHHIVR